MIFGRPAIRYLGCCINIANDTVRLNHDEVAVELQEVVDRPRLQDVTNSTASGYFASESSDDTSTSNLSESADEMDDNFVIMIKGKVTENQKEERLPEKLEHLYDQYRHSLMDMISRIGVGAWSLHDLRLADVPMRPHLT